MLYRLSLPGSTHILILAKWRGVWIEIHINGFVYQIYDELQLLILKYPKILRYQLKVNVNWGINVYLIMCLFPSLSCLPTVKLKVWYSVWFLILEKQLSSLELLENTTIELCLDLLKMKVGFSPSHHPVPSCQAIRYVLWSFPPSVPCSVSCISCLLLLALIQACARWSFLSRHACASSSGKPFSVSPLGCPHQLSSRCAEWSQRRPFGSCERVSFLSVFSVALLVLHAWSVGVHGGPALQKTSCWGPRQEEGGQTWFLLVRPWSSPWLTCRCPQCPAHWLAHERCSVTLLTCIACGRQASVWRNESGKWRKAVPGSVQGTGFSTGPLEHWA